MVARMQNERVYKFFQISFSRFQTDLVGVSIPHNRGRKNESLDEAIVGIATFAILRCIKLSHDCSPAVRVDSIPGLYYFFIFDHREEFLSNSLYILHNVFGTEKLVILVIARNNAFATTADVEI